MESSEADNHVGQSVVVNGVRLHATKDTEDFSCAVPKDTDRFEEISFVADFTMKRITTEDELVEFRMQVEVHCMLR
jgi:hypothetical protein